MPYPNEHAARLANPGVFTKFRRSNDAGGSGVHFIYGIKGGKSEIQSIRFDKSKFTTAEAHAWLKKNKKSPISFEPARSGGKTSEHADAGGAAPAAGPSAVSSSAITVPTALKKPVIQYSYSEELGDEFWDEGKAINEGIGYSDVDPEQLKIGTTIEYEHTSSLAVAEKIALDHLAEYPTYYTALLEMERKLGEEY